MDLFDIAETIGKILDFAGVLIILGGVIIATGIVLTQLIEGKNKGNLYKSYRKNLGRSILLGLELLVAGDIIRSITGEPSFTNVIILGIIVIIRSFLGVTFEMEIEGRWPWQESKKETGSSH